MREPLDYSNRHAGLLLYRFGRIVGQARGPTGDERAGAGRSALWRELLTQDDMRNAQCQRAFHTGPASNPLIGVGAGLRHTRFDLHEFCAAAGAPLAHHSVTDRLRHARVPGAEEISSEGDDISRASKVERRQSGMTKAEQICLAQNSFIVWLIPDCRWRAVGFQETLDEFVALSA